MLGIVGIFGSNASLFFMVPHPTMCMIKMERKRNDLMFVGRMRVVG